MNVNTKKHYRQTQYTIRFFLRLTFWRMRLRVRGTILVYDLVQSIYDFTMVIIKQVATEFFS